LYLGVHADRTKDLLCKRRDALVGRLIAQREIITFSPLYGTQRLAVMECNKLTGAPSL